jgi:phage shock protein PspC (stress-responsive transcriptional regulator)
VPGPLVRVPFIVTTVTGLTDADMLASERFGVVEVVIRLPEVLITVFFGATGIVIAAECVLATSLTRVVSVALGTKKQLNIIKYIVT